MRDVFAGPISAEIIGWEGRNEDRARYLVRRIDQSIRRLVGVYVKNAVYFTLGVMNPLSRFDQFLLSKSDADAMRSEFALVLTETTFTRDEPLRRLLTTYKKVSGIYFWIARHEGKEYKIYIGQTNSLANRLINYVSEFQAHSTNDFKMRAFAAFLAELAPNAALDLYFFATDSYKEAEKHAIRKYDPLLNKLPSPSAESRERLKSAFESYYRSSFELRLAK